MFLCFVSSRMLRVLISQSVVDWLATLGWTTRIEFQQRTVFLSSTLHAIRLGTHPASYVKGTGISSDKADGALRTTRPDVSRFLRGTLPPPLLYVLVLVTWYTTYYPGTELEYSSQRPRLTAWAMACRRMRQRNIHISLTECNSDTIQKLPFGGCTTIELKNITTGTLVSWNTRRRMLVLSDAVVIFFRSVVVSTPNGQFLDCATVAFIEQFVLQYLT